MPRLLACLALCAGCSVPPSDDYAFVEDERPLTKAEFAERVVQKFDPAGMLADALFGVGAAPVSGVCTSFPWDRNASQARQAAIRDLVLQGKEDEAYTAMLTHFPSVNAAWLCAHDADPNEALANCVLMRFSEIVWTDLTADPMYNLVVNRVMPHFKRQYGCF